jgi:hypothetical protein
MTAEIAVTLRTNEVTIEAKKLSRTSGKVTVVKTLKLFAPISKALSSIDLSICRNEAVALRVPIGKERTIKTMMMIQIVP